MNHNWHVLYTRYLQRITTGHVTAATESEVAAAGTLFGYDRAYYESIGILLEAA